MFPASAIENNRLECDAAVGALCPDASAPGTGSPSSKTTVVTMAKPLQPSRCRAAHTVILGSHTKVRSLMWLSNPPRPCIVHLGIPVAPWNTRNGEQNTEFGKIKTDVSSKRRNYTLASLEFVNDKEFQLKFSTKQQSKRYDAVETNCLHLAFYSMDRIPPSVYREGLRRFPHKVQINASCSFPVNPTFDFLLPCLESDRGVLMD
ncbi:hypothetical protein Ae201684P_022324 [Aphanomyces euteiches]|uniref:Uncharacterized protein n=1 Tax=Aphanomyces euteiches TaxID=100861 RepID=A0A6G0X6L9_9STRA|nr:hypothetical protein Ae201684_007930 [Aphanomyces euteiches]KAH9074517.1 hypothetical protein Ae201684P_022324 [Aphanomyces euteiches]